MIGIACWIVRGDFPQLASRNSHSAERAIQELNLGQAEEIRRILHGHLVHLVSGHAVEVVL
jgi:hypothetical protein